MVTINIGNPPDHGLLSVEIPAGKPWRAAQDTAGRPVPCQFIPAPYGNAATAGRLLVQVPPGAAQILLTEGPEPAPVPGSAIAALGQGDLEVTLGSRKITLRDRLDTNAWDKSWALEAIRGVFPLVNEGSTLTTVSDGPLAQVARLTTALKENGGDKTLPATAYMDIVAYKALPLVEATLCFDAKGPVASGSVRFFEIKLPKEGFTRWAGGEPRYEGTLEDATHYIPYEVEGFRPRAFNDYAAIDGPDRGLAVVGGIPVLTADEDTVGLTPNNDCSGVNLQDFGAGHPFSAFVVYGDGPVDGAAWMGRLPRVLKVPACRCEAVCLKSGDMSLFFQDNGAGVDMIGLEDEKSGAWLQSAGHPLFRVVLREVGGDAQYALSANEGWGQVTLAQDEDMLSMVFSRPLEERLAGVTILLTAQCDAARSRVSWDMNIVNASEGVSVLLVDYPTPSYEAADGACAFIPRACGEVREGLTRGNLHQVFTYPTFSGAMQYGAVYDAASGRGLYVGAHDPEGCYKQFNFDASLLTRRGYLRFIVPAENLDEPANSFTLPGRSVWQFFSGDWYDAAQIYKDWVTKHAFWIPELTDEGRRDMARWIVENPFWFQDGVDDEGNWVTAALEAQRDLNVPSAYHVYQWHQIPFDNDYPHYNPARDEFLRGLPQLQRAGIKVMPYINGRLWDTHDKGNEDWQFTKIAKPFATKNRHGEVITETYVSREEDGERVKLAVMCPSTALWQEKQREINDWLFNTVGVDAVYLDQIAAAEPKLCMDKTHSHRPGGGAWWNYAYYNLLDHLKKVRPEGGAFTTECNGETYMRCIDAYLTWHWTRANQVPAFSAVYAGYAPMFGRSYGSARKGDALAFRILASQSLLFGEQIGWVSPRAYLDSPYRALFKKIVTTRHAWGDFFYAGQMLRPPVIESPQPELTTLNIMAGNEVINTPVVRGALWQRLKDGARIMILINIGDDPIDVTGRVDGCDGEAALSGDMEGALKIQGGAFALTMPAVSVIVARIQ